MRILDIKALETVDRITNHSNGAFQWCLTGWFLRKHVAVRCEEAGWLESHPCVVTGGDGYASGKTERWRIGYRLTGEGKRLLAEIQGAKVKCWEKAKEMKP